MYTGPTLARVSKACWIDNNQSAGSMTAGKGSYTMRLSSYEAVPASMLEKTIADVKRLRSEDD